MQALSRPSLATPLLVALALVTAPCLAAEKHAAQGEKHHAAKSAAAKKSHDGKHHASKRVAAKKPHEGKQHASKSSAPGKADWPSADLGKVRASKDVVQVANWVSSASNNEHRPFVIIDKKAAHMYVFDGWGRLWNHSPVLVGKAVGDDVAPGVGRKRLAQLKAHEKTTPAGRFEARTGKDSHGANVVWIDYDAALSMHATASVSASERRAERMATPTPKDNRISNGCINVPPKFFRDVLWPTVRKAGAVVYVLPETRTPYEQFSRDRGGDAKSPA
jgi:hypothetical protein